MTKHVASYNGNQRAEFPDIRVHTGTFGNAGEYEGTRMSNHGRYLKKHTEALVKDVGIENACALTGKSKATLGRYYSDNDEHADRFMPVDAVAALEAEASYHTRYIGTG